MERFVENIKSEAQKQSGVWAHTKEEKLSSNMYGEPKESRILLPIGLVGFFILFLMSINNLFPYNSRSLEKLGTN